MRTDSRNQREIERDPPRPPHAQGGRGTWARWLAAASLMYCGSSLAASAAIIELKGEARVSSPVVQLGHVAQIHDADEKLVARLAAVTLFPAPPAGRSKSVDFETIRGRLVSQGFSVSDLEFQGSSQVTVGTVRPVDASDASDTAISDISRRRAEELIAKAVRQLLAEQAPALGSVQVDPQLSPKQIALINSAVATKIEVFGGKEPWVGPQEFRAAFYDRQGRRQEYQVSAVVKPLPHVIVASATLNKGQIVRAEDVTLKQRPQKVTDTPLCDREELVVGQEVIRRVQAGEPIAVRDVRGVPLVRRGDIVTVVARGGGIVIRTDAKATMDGGL
ncbi:MAG: flagellar basal body P-ring formation protein FlgA, partial [Planctomycetia bacterium]|nr:flagellar basal body P-ring formation protein FlgA [Planctomycetia bacterium]